MKLHDGNRRYIIEPTFPGSNTWNVLDTVSWRLSGDRMVNARTVAEVNYFQAILCAECLNAGHDAWAWLDDSEAGES